MSIDMFLYIVCFIYVLVAMLVYHESYMNFRHVLEVKSVAAKMLSLFVAALWPLFIVWIIVWQD